MKPAYLLLRLPDDEGKADDLARALPLKVAEPLRGETIDAFRVRQGWEFMGLPTVARIGKLYYPREEWATRKIRKNETLVFIQRPLGGGGGGSSGKRNILGAVAMLALVVIATVVAGPWGASIVGAFGAKVAGALILAGGSMLISRFLKPKATGTGKKEELQSFASSSNQARPLQTIPVGYGRRISYPDVSDPPYSEFDGDLMTSYALYCVGCGEYDVEELRLNDTPFWLSSSGIQSGFEGIEVQIVPPGQNVTLFPLNVVTATGFQPAELANTDPAPVIINAPNTQVKQILLDLVFPSGLYSIYSSKNIVGARTVTMVAEARPVDSAGVATGVWSEVWREVYSATQQSQIRLTRRIDVAPGRYQLRVKRTTAGVTDTATGADQVYLQSVRAHIHGSQSRAGVTQIAIKFAASKALAHLNSAKLASITTRKLNYFNPTSGQWEFGPTRSIAWALYDVWTNQDYSAGLPATRMDLANLVEMHEKWAALGHTFDHFFTEPVTVMAAMEAIANAGRAYPNVIGDTVAFTRDEYRAIPRLMFTDDQIIRGSFKRKTSLYRQSLADGIVGSYLDENTWRPAQVSSAGDGVVLAQPSQIEIVGVTKRAQAAGLIRFQAADSMLRRQTIEFQTELDGFLARKGDLVALQTELPQTWGAASQVADYNPSTGVLTFSIPQTWAASTQHYLELRGARGEYWGPVKCARGMDDSHAVVDLADAVIVAGQQGAEIANVLSRTSTEEMPSIVLGTASKRSARVLIIDGQPAGQHHITLTGVIDHPDVYNVTETGVAPLPALPSFRVPAPPVIVFTVVGVAQAGLSLVLRAAWVATDAERYIVQLRGGDGVWTTIERADQASTYIEHTLALPAPQSATLRVAGILPSGQPGQWSTQVLTVPALVLDPTQLEIDIGLESLSAELVTQITETKATSDRVSGIVSRIVAVDPQRQIDALAVAVAENMALSMERGSEHLSTHAVAVQGIDARITDTGVAIAELRTDLEAQTELSAAHYGELTQAISDGDEAIATRTTALEASIVGAIGSIDDLSALIDTVNTASVTRDTQIAGAVTTAQTAADGAVANAQQAIGASTTASQTIASLTGSVNAVFGGDSSSALMRVTSVAQSGGVSAEVSFGVRASVGGIVHETGLVLRPREVTIKASNFYLTDPSWNGGAPGNVFTYSSGKFVFNIPVGFAAGVIGTSAIAQNAVTKLLMVSSSFTSGFVIGYGPTYVNTGVNALSKEQSGQSSTATDPYIDVVFDPNDVNYIHLEFVSDIVTSATAGNWAAFDVVLTRNIANVVIPVSGCAYASNADIASAKIYSSKKLTVGTNGTRQDTIILSTFDVPPAAGTYRYRVMINNANVTVSSGYAHLAATLHKR